MSKTFSTKLSPKVLHLLNQFCAKHHLKKSHMIEEFILEGIRRQAETLELAKSIQRGLEEETSGQLLTADQVYKQVFGK